jgi:hypothetical protein
MKKIIFGLFLLFAMVTKLSAQVPVIVDTTGTKYWYYPSQNLYYNDVTGDYWYYDEATTKWADVKKLPGTIKFAVTDDRYPVYYKGTDIWRDNKVHLSKYKVKKNGTVKQKTKTDQ